MTWRERIVRARAYGVFTADDEQAARMWISCAVGEQHEAMPHVVLYAEEAPLDAKLHRMGATFCLRVRDNKIDAAEALLDAIEDRTLAMKRASIEPDRSRIVAQNATFCDR